jgi:hypothetical protein
MRKRFWIELGVAASASFLSLLAIAWPDWIEAVFGVSPDGGDGALEWLVAAVPLTPAIVAGALARLEWRRVTS